MTSVRGSSSANDASTMLLVHAFIHPRLLMLRKGSLYRFLWSWGPCVVTVRKGMQFSRRCWTERNPRCTIFRSRLATLSAPRNNASTVHYYEVTIPNWLLVVVGIYLLTDHTNTRARICSPNSSRCSVPLRIIRSSNDIYTLVLKRSVGDQVSVSGIRNRWGSEGRSCWMPYKIFLSLWWRDGLFILYL